MDLVVVVIGLEVVDGMLPVCSQDITRRALEALIDLFPMIERLAHFQTDGAPMRLPTFAHVPAYSSGTGAYPCAES